MKRSILATLLPARVSLLIATLAAPSITFAAPATAPAMPAKQAPRTYCGVHCLYAAARIEGRPIEFRDLVTEKYIRDTRGSSLADLVRAAEDHGLHARAVGDLTSRELRAAKHPVILHVKYSDYSKGFDHYVLFAGADGDDALVLDPPKALQKVPFAELAARWDGVGLVVAASPLAAQPIGWQGWQIALGLMVSTAVVGMTWHRYGRRRAPARGMTTEQTLPPRERLWGAVGQCGQLVSLSLIIGILYHSFHSEGILASPAATESIARAHQIGFLDKLDAPGVRQAIEQHAIIIDCRLAADYQAGHLPGAISVPIDAPRETKLKALEGVPRDSRVILYCQSDKCTFAEKVANLMMDQGFTDLALFPGGWLKWVEQGKSGA